MNYINLLDNPPPKKLIDEGDELTKELIKLKPEERKKFIEDNSKYWRKLKKHYLGLSNKKCWYTDVKEKVSDYHMDHFRPKMKVNSFDMEGFCKTVNNDDSYWWLAFCWENYRLSGSIPNTKKKCFFPLKEGTSFAKNKGDICSEWPALIDPICKEDTELITFDKDGKVQPTVDEKSDSWDAQRVKISVEVYDLDNIVLQEARIQIQQQCQQFIDLILSLRGKSGEYSDDELKKDWKTAVAGLKKLVLKENELSSVARDYVLKYGDMQIRKILLD